MQSVLSKFLLLFLVAVSVFALVLVPLLIQPNLQANASPLRRPLVGTIYCAVCILGITAVFYPNKCRMIFQKPNGSFTSTKPSASKVQLRGHHPDCEKFSANRITIGGSVFCAACSGLLIGAFTAILGVVLFSLGFFDPGTRNLWLLAVGEVLMLVGLAQIKTGGYLKMAMNAMFVFGSGISLVAVDLAAQSFLVDVFMLGIIVYLLWLRILLSEWKNKKTCMLCGHCL